MTIVQGVIIGLIIGIIIGWSATANYYHNKYVGKEE